MISLGDDPRVRRYAALLVRIAVNVQKGQRLTIWKAPVDAAPFVRVLVDEAYLAGASQVDVFWHDDQMELVRISRTEPAAYENNTTWAASVMEASATAGGAFLFFDCTCAGMFDNTPAAVVARVLALESSQLARVWHFFIRNTVNWSIATVPTESWAQKVFPELEPEAGITSLWETMFATCRVDTEDYEERWRTHLHDLGERGRLLNSLNLQELRFRGTGTDLVVGLPEKHIWQHPGFLTTAGVPFIADIPIEEVFTLPDRGATEGTVRSTRPLVVSGRTVENFSLEFRNGKVTRIDGEPHAREMLNNLVNTNEGADRLGEVAIVPEDSLVARQHRTFYNTIFDENASCHLALGRAYRFCLEGGDAMEDQSFIGAGGNISPVHADFMIGSEQLDIVGTTSAGKKITILERGRWALH